MPRALNEAESTVREASPTAFVEKPWEANEDCFSEEAFTGVSGLLVLP
jgi:hypothetical protein